MNHSQKEYLGNVLRVIQEIERLLLYSINGNKIEYKIIINKQRDIKPTEEWRIVKQLIKKNVVDEYEESERYEAMVGKMVLDPEMVMYLIVDQKKLEAHSKYIQSELKKDSIDESDQIIWPKEYKWISNKQFQAKIIVSFFNNKSNVLDLFKILIENKNNWVKKADLIEILTTKNADNLRSNISQLKSKLVGSGLKIEPRKNASKSGAYRITPTS